MPNAVAAPCGEISVSSEPTEREAPRQSDANGDRVVALELIQRARQHMIAHRVQRLQIRLTDAAHEAAGRLPCPSAQQNLAIDHRNHRDDIRDLADLAGNVVVVGKLAAGAIHAEMAVEAEDAREQVHLEPAHHAHHDDQRGDAERDADQRKDRDDGDEALASPGAQIAAGDRAFEGSEHALRRASRHGRPRVHALWWSLRSASSGDTSLRSPVARRFNSTLPAAAPRGPTMICHG